MNFNFKHVLLMSFLLSLVSWAKDFYVAPNGNDKNLGALSSPFASIMAAQSAASSGDTVYLRGGTYSLNNDNITSTDSVRAYVNTITKNGISYIAYPEEQPIFDFNNVKPADLRVVAFFVSGDNNVFEGFEVVGVQVTIDYKRTQSTAFRVDGGDYNRFERLSIHDGMAIGWFLQSGSYNQVINVDVYNNKGLNHYSHGNVDGFGIHSKSETGVGNIIKGCRAWFNSDDGFDFINSNAQAIVENSWAMYNGYDTDFTRMADGHGFKAGGYGRNGKVDYPVPVPRHVVKNCLAVGNKASGFYANHHTGGIDWIHNTAIKNPHNYNMLSTDVETNAQDIPGFDHYMRNNLGYGATSTEVINLGSSKINDLSSNYFGLSVVVNNNDFVNLNETQLMAPRQANGDLPIIDFAHLVESSDLIDAGIDIDSPFSGGAPDLGAFEKTITKKNITKTPTLINPQNTFNHPQLEFPSKKQTVN